MGPQVILIFPCTDFPLWQILFLNSFVLVIQLISSTISCPLFIAMEWCPIVLTDLLLYKYRNGENVSQNFGEESEPTNPINVVWLVSAVFIVSSWWLQWVFNIGLRDSLAISFGLINNSFFKNKDYITRAWDSIIYLFMGIVIYIFIYFV